MYGGRAIDNFDRRVLNTYMNEYMGDFIFDTFQPFHFFENDEVDYCIPTLKEENKEYVSMSLGLFVCFVKSFFNFNIFLLLLN